MKEQSHCIQILSFNACHCIQILSFNAAQQQGQYCPHLLLWSLPKTLCSFLQYSRGRWCPLVLLRLPSSRARPSPGEWEHSEL